MPRTSLLSLALDEFERRFILNELISHRWNRKQTARDLGISYRGLLYKIERLDLRPPQAGEGAA